MVGNSRKAGYTGQVGTPFMRTVLADLRVLNSTLATLGNYFVVSLAITEDGMLRT